MSRTMEKSPSPEYPVVVPGVGPIPAMGMIIGEAPGRNEIEQGIPFCGRSGEVLTKALDLVPSSRDDWYITNIFKGDVGSGNRNPTAAEIEAHREILEEEFATVRPAGILLLGRFATDAFLPDGGRMESLVGRRYSLPQYDCVYFPCWHPAYILRNPGRWEDFKYAVIKFSLVSEVLWRHRAEV